MPDRETKLVEILPLCRTIHRAGARIDPTLYSYGPWREAYGFFNRRLFDGALPPCLITFQRKNRTLGYFSSCRFKSADGTQIHDEIALNPAHFEACGDKDVLSTLVHEMVHLWQYHFGTPSRASYHNAEWAAKMCASGLLPSHTGLPGGKQTGQRMTHCIEPEGHFDRAANELIAEGFKVEFVERERGDLDPIVIKKRRSKTHFKCPCGQESVFGRPSTRVRCDGCHGLLVPCN